MRLNAYVMAADPAFLAASIASYYEAVERIVVSFDKNHLSWSGEPIPVEQCLQEVIQIDRDGKLDLQPGDYSAPGRPLLECDTRQRQAALDAASEDADWVIQIDGDEVVPDLRIFLDSLGRADETGADALEFPARWLYAQTIDGRFLEGCSRWWRTAGAFPGPLAVRAGVRLRLARQCYGTLFRVDFRPKNTDPWHPRDAPVHATVPVDAGVLHFSWVRAHDHLERKASISGHRDDVDWEVGIRRWTRRQRYPLLTTAFTPLRRRGLLHPSWLKVVSLPVVPPQALLLDPSIS